MVFPTDIMIQLLAYTSGHSNDTKRYSSASGPVNLGDWKTTNKHYSIDGIKIHQIHGHSPQGFGCDITPLFDEYDNFYGSIVNLDNSNIFMSNNRRLYGKDINNNSYNYLEIDAVGEYTIDTSLFIDKSGFKSPNELNYGDKINLSNPLQITFSSNVHLSTTYKNLYNKLKTAKYVYKFSGFVSGVDDHIVIMKPIEFNISVKIDTQENCIKYIVTTTSSGGASRKNRRNTNHTQHNRNSKRGYLTTTSKSRNQQKQNKTRKCTCANCRSMRR